MTSIQALGPTSEPGDVQALAGRRPLRAGQRGAPRFQLASPGAADEATPAARKGAAARQRTVDTDPEPAADGPILPGPDLAQLSMPANPSLSPDKADAANLPEQAVAAEAVTDAQRPVDSPADSTGPSDTLSPVSPQAGDGRRAASAAAARSPEAGPSPAELADSAAEERPVAAAPVSSNSASSPAPIPGAASAPAGSETAEAVGPASGARAGHAAVAQLRPAAKPDRPQTQAAMPMSVRMEHAEVRAGGAASPAARLPEGTPEPQLPADILVAQDSRGAGLDVTIAAATTDLRDRFRAAMDELQADLAAIGTEVDAIRVELRDDPADGQSGGGGTSGGESGAAEASGVDTARTDAGWAASDAMALLEQGGADTERNQPDEAPADDGLDDQADAGAGGMHGGETARDRADRTGEQLRLRISQRRQSADPSPAAPGLDMASMGRGQRIDRYA